MVSAFALYGMLAAIGGATSLGANRFSTNDRVFIQSKASDSLPFSYVGRVGALPGVPLRSRGLRRGVWAPTTRDERKLSSDTVAVSNYS